MASESAVGEQVVHGHDGVPLVARVWKAPAGVAVRGDVLLVHGLASNARLWDGMAALLAAAGHRTVAIDQRGHGQSAARFGDDPRHDGPFDMDLVAADLAAVIEELGLERPLVAGQSWGGNVVLALGHRHPSLVAGVVLVDGGWITLSRAFDTFEDCWDQLAPPPFGGTPWNELEALMRRGMQGWPDAGVAGQLANLWVDDDGGAWPHLTRERHREVLRGLYEDVPAERYPSVEVPVLLLPAADPSPVGDELDPRQVATVKAVEEAVALLPDAHVHWFPGRHHDVHAQAPDEVVAVLSEARARGFFG